MKLPLFLFTLTLSFSGSLAHGNSTGLYFTAAEIEANRENAQAISQAAAACLKGYWDEHTRFYDAHHYSKFYGNRNRRYATPDDRKFALLKILHPELIRDGDEKNIKLEILAERGADHDNDGNPAEYISLKDFEHYAAQTDRSVFRAIERLKPELTKRESELKDISCVDMARRCLGRGFAKVGMSDTWHKIDSYVIHHGVSGIEMQKALVDLGWEAIYWNPDPSQNAVWDHEDRQLTPLDPKRVWMPVWGGHALRYQTAIRHHAYFGVPLRDVHTLVGFQNQTPEGFKRVPFFVGTAHSGYHVFPGTFGRVVEGHSVRDLDSRDNLQFSPFNPLEGTTGGGPQWTRTEHYRSGVIVVPPGIMSH